MGSHRRTQDLITALVDQLGPGPWPRGLVADAGLTDDQIRGAVRAGRLVRPHNGVLDTPGTTGPRAEFAAVYAAMLTAPPGAAVSHRTAGSVQGLWLPAARDPHVHLTVPGDQDEVRHGVRIHGSPLPAHLVTEKDGLAITALARTAVDVARGRRLPEALLVLDSAMRLLSGGHDVAAFRDDETRRRARSRGLVLLREAYDSVWSWPGSVVVRDALPLADPASESPFESLSRGWMVLDGLPMPLLAQPVVGASGCRWWADFVWPGSRVIGEADGLGKYGGTSGEVRLSLAAERHRQRDLEDAGWRVVRWDTQERARVWLARLRSAVAPR